MRRIDKDGKKVQVGLTDTITSNLDVLIPVGLTIMGIMIAVSLIPRIVYKFL